MPAAGDRAAGGGGGGEVGSTGRQENGVTVPLSVYTGRGTCFRGVTGASRLTCK